jgi:predicted  nucleic acid-binding Zn-ribbon protein
MRFLFMEPSMNSSRVKEAQVQSDIELLLKLQVIDYDLGELERSKDYLPDMMNNLNHEIVEAQKKLEEISAALEKAKVDQKNLELEISTKEAELQKYQQQMMTIKTNKEYDALVGEIDSVKSEIGSREQLLLSTMEKIETLEKELPEATERLNHIKENNTNQLQILQEKIDSIGDKTSDKNSERKEILSQVPKPIMSVYERVRKGKGGAVVVSVKKRSCSSCHKSLTPKKIQEIRRANGIHTCESCGRMLYWDDDVSD